MNTRTPLLACAFAALFLVLPPAFARADTPAVAVVRQFLADRAAGRYDAAYRLLSAGFRLGGSENGFATGDAIPASEARHWPAPAFGLIDLFLDTHDTLGYKFALIGPDPADSHFVLVRASPPAGTANLPAAILRLLTVSDPAVHTPRIDAAGSLNHAAPKEFTEARQRAELAMSMSNLKQISLGIIQYVQDNDEKMPDADKWVDEILPYVKDPAVFHDPSAPAGEKWSYAYNSALSHKPLAQLDAPAQTVMLFESSKGIKNASDTGQSVPRPGRHLGGTDYAFADGHVKWFPDGTKLSYRMDGK